MPAKLNARAAVLFAGDCRSRRCAYVIAQADQRQNLLKLELVVVRPVQPHDQRIRIVRLIVQRRKVAATCTGAYIRASPPDRFPARQLAKPWTNRRNAIHMLLKGDLCEM